MKWLVLVVLAILLAVALFTPSYLAVRKLYQRPCAGIRWRRRFPDVSPDDIREFLQLFVEALGFRRKHKLRFRPDDKVLDLLHALYPRGLWPDEGELEDFAVSLQERYHVDLTAIWREDIILGEIFSYSRQQQQTT